MAIYLNERMASPPKSIPVLLHLGGRGGGVLGGSVVKHQTPGREVRGFETYLCRVVSLSKTFYSPKVLVIPRQWWLRPDMTENC